MMATVAGKKVIDLDVYLKRNPKKNMWDYLSEVNKIYYPPPKKASVPRPWQSPILANKNPHFKGNFSK
jgi:hypothetical protein